MIHVHETQKREYIHVHETRIQLFIHVDQSTISITMWINKIFKIPSHEYVTSALIVMKSFAFLIHFTSCVLIVPLILQNCTLFVSKFEKCQRSSASLITVTPKFNSLESLPLPIR